MIYEDIIVSGSINISGSFTVPVQADSSSALQVDGSVYHDSTDTTLKIYSGSTFTDVATQPFVAPVEIEYLVVAGGGGGGAAGAGAGGGGAGGLLSSSLSDIESGSSITVTVGSGGSKGTGTQYGNGGSDGGDSSIASAGGTSFTTVTCTGGGGGSAGGSGVNGRDGGSGGGGNGGYNTDGGSGTTGQGNDGGDAAAYSNGSGTDHYAAGGGGGAAQAGGDATAASGVETGGNGGDGKQSSITGTSTYYAGGGGGGAGYRSSSPTGGSAGQGGGTAGSSNKVGNASNATANTGGGGGGGGGYTTTDPNSGSDRDGGNGGSGVVIFAYDSGSTLGAGGIVGDAGGGRRYHQFNSTGTFYIGSTSDFQLPATSNLKLHLDAANYDSYSGTGTTWYDISGNNNDFTLDSSGITWNAGGWFDLEDGGLTKTGGAVTTSSTVTFALWIKTTDTQALFWSDDNNTNYLGAYRSGNKEYYNDVGSPVYYQDLVEKSNIYDNIRTGNWIFVEFKSVNFSTHGTSNYINQYGSYTFSGTDVGAYYVYNKNLTAAESAQLYNATKHNFV